MEGFWRFLLAGGRSSGHGLSGYCRSSRKARAERSPSSTVSHGCRKVVRGSGALWSTWRGCVSDDRSHHRTGPTFGRVAQVHRMGEGSAVGARPASRLSATATKASPLQCRGRRPYNRVMSATTLGDIANLLNAPPPANAGTAITGIATLLE